MNMIACPLCGVKNIKTIEVVKVIDLVNLYSNAYDADFNYLFEKSEINYNQCGVCDLKYFHPSVIGDENFYNILQKTDLYYVDDKEEYATASEYITKKDSVLEIGCGKAAFSKRIHYKDYTGLELSTNAKKLAEQGGVQIINQTIQEHSITNANKYDVVCTFQVLEHVDCDDLSSFLKAAVDCLKVDGRLIISVPSADSFLSDMVNSTLNLPPHHQTHWPDKSMKEIAKMYNLDILCFEHETIAARNKREYLFVKLRRILAFNNHKLIMEKATLLQRIALRVLRFIPFSIQSLIINKINPNGHSITVVYQKKRSS